MNKQEQQKQLERMMRFIDQEAAEKAEEIITKARSEISALKNQQVRKRKEELKEKFSKMSEEVKVEKKIMRSRKYNEMKVSTMRARDDKLNSVKEEVKKLLIDVSSNAQYQQLILHLLVEGLLRMQEKKVTVRCREMDRKIVEPMLPQAVTMFQDLVKARAGVDFKTSLVLSDEHLDGPPREGYKGCCGGVVLTARNGRIILRNTFDSRLDVAFYCLKPALRGLCFGEREKIADTKMERGVLSND
jgi:V-type H+-transporting ATPase subunit E